MKNIDPLAKLLKAAAAAPQVRVAQDVALPFALETRVLATWRAAADPFPILPLFRRAFAAALVIAIISAGIHMRRSSGVDAYDLTLNYSIAAAYVQ